MMMKRTIVFCSLIAAGLMAAQATAPATLPPGAIAVVNGQPIARGLLDELIRARQQGGAPASLQERRAMLDDLVNMEVMSQRARQAGLAERPQVRAELELAQKTLLGQRLLQQLSRDMVVDDATLRARYDALPIETEITTSHILVADETAAHQIIGRLKKGAKFAELARQHSIDTQSKDDGGSIGPMAASELSPAYAAAAMALTPGHHSTEPVKTEFGWHVILLSAQRERPRPEYAAIQPSLRMGVVSERLQAQLDQWKKDAKLTVLHAP